MGENWVGSTLVGSEAEREIKDKFPERIRMLFFKSKLTLSKLSNLNLILPLTQSKERSSSPITFCFYLKR
jgi:hypothetical protein